MALTFVPGCATSASLNSRRRREQPNRISKQRDGGVGTTVALNRFMFTADEVNTSGTVVLLKDDYRACHVRNILHLPQSGGHTRAGVLNESLLDEVPVDIDANSRVTFWLNRGIRREMPMPPPITLVLAVPRPKVLARLLPQIAAIGIRDLILCNAYKVEKCYFHSTLLTNREELDEHLIEGISQSGVDARLPSVAVEKRLKIFLEDRLQALCTPESRLLIAEPGSHTSLFQTLLPEGRGHQKHRDGGDHIVLAIGPEGGWMPREVSMFENVFNFSRVSLGDRILRTDAAVLVLLGLVHEFIRVRNQHLS